MQLLYFFFNCIIRYIFDENVIFHCVKRSHFILEKSALYSHQIAFKIQFRLRRVAISGWINYLKVSKWITNLLEYFPCFPKHGFRITNTAGTVQAFKYRTFYNRNSLVIFDIYTTKNRLYKESHTYIFKYSCTHYI